MATSSPPPTKKVKAEAGGTSPTAKETHTQAGGASHAEPVPALKKSEALEAAPPPPAGLDRPLGAELHTTEATTTILESGRIVFLARPTKAAEAAGHIADSGDVRTFFIALVPARSDEREEGKKKEKEEGAWESKARLIIVGRKYMPSMSDKHWGFVQSVGDTFADLFSKPAGEAATAEASGGGGTKKRKAAGGGSAAAGPADADTRLRVLAEGDYALTRVRKDVSTGRLTFVLAEPHAAGSEGGPPARPALGEVGLEQAAGRLVISVKNPATANVAGAGLGKDAKAHFSEAAQAAFRGKGATAKTAAHGLAWVNFSAHPDLISTRHSEVLLIGANEPEVSDPALAASLRAAAEADHKAHVAAGGGGGGGAAAEGEGEEGDEHEQHAAEEEAAVRSALEAELEAAKMHLDALPAATGELD